jgi:MFS family permease
MSAVWGTQAGLTVPQISLFITVIYVGGLLAQYSIGWVSDRMDRRVLILILAVIGGVGGLLGAVASGYFPLYLLAGFVIGGLSNPLYALLLAYANDYMAREDMPAASAGFLFINGVGAIFGPLITGWLMETVGSWGYFLFIAVLMFALGGYTAWRMKRRKRRGRIGEGGFVAVTPSASQVAVEAAQEVYLDRQDER